MGRGLKLADFGSCRGIYSKQPYTEYISTRWYRAPECLLTDGYYGPEMDLWGAGCVFFEITSLYPLFPGTNELDQINRIHKVLGTPGPDLLAKFKRNGAAHVNFDFPEQKGIGLAQLIPHATPDCVDLMVKMLAYDASDRMSAREGLQHPYFRDIRELEARRQAQPNGTDNASSTGGSGGDGASASEGASVGGAAASGGGGAAWSQAGDALLKSDKGGEVSARSKGLPNIGAGSGDAAAAQYGYKASSMPKQ
jgi:renal tumor antigen